MPLNKVFVIGAGASQEFGLPVGSELKSHISRLCSTAPDHLYGLKSTSREFSGILSQISTSMRDPTGMSALRAAQLISKGLPQFPSIDNFIHFHQSNEAVVAVAKAAIAVALSVAERGSKISHNDENLYSMINLELASGTWLQKLFTMLCEASSFDMFIERLKSITFISFNYDRCIQQYILWAAKLSFDLLPAQLLEVRGAINVTYVYGHLGDILVDGMQISGFGQSLDRFNFEDSASRVRTFTEGVSEDGVKVSIQNLLGSADIVGFFGFGFHKLNFELFRGPKKFSAQRVIVTTRGLSSEDRDLLYGDLSEIFNLDTEIEMMSKIVSFEALECQNVFDHHYRYLTSVL